MSKNSTNQSANQIKKSTILPNHLRRDFSSEFEILDRVLSTGRATISNLPTKSAAHATRNTLYRARSQHRKIATIEAESGSAANPFRYDSVFVEIKEKPNCWEIELVHAEPTISYGSD